jgi:hypothetical protein
MEEDFASMSDVRIPYAVSKRRIDYVMFRIPHAGF